MNVKKYIEKKQLLNQAKKYRGFAKSGVTPRAYIKEAEKLEKRALRIK